MTQAYVRLVFVEARYKYFIVLYCKTSALLTFAGL